MKSRLFLLVIGLFLATALAQGQQGVSRHYDTARTILLKGTVTAVFFMGRERIGFLFIEVQDANGRVEKWAVAGNPQKTLLEAGWVFDPPSPTLTHRAAVTVAAYLPIPGADLADLLPSVASLSTVPGLPSPAERFNAGRLVYGNEVALPSGNKLVFGDLK